MFSLYIIDILSAMLPLIFVHPPVARGLLRPSSIHAADIRLQSDLVFHFSIVPSRLSVPRPDVSRQRRRSRANIFATDPENAAKTIHATATRQGAQNAAMRSKSAVRKVRLLVLIEMLDARLLARCYRHAHPPARETPGDPGAIDP